MKKIKILILLFLLWPISSQGQWIDHTINLSVFTGKHYAQQNAYNNGYWYGLYAEYSPIRTIEGFNLGLALLASHSEFKSNDKLQKYSGKSSQFGTGISSGKYWEFFSLNHSAYLGGNLMLRKNYDQGLGNSLPGQYLMTQEDFILSAEISFNLLKNFGRNENLFPRTQIKFSWQKPLDSKKIDFWNQQEIPESMIWNKAAREIGIKKSFINLGKFENQVQLKALSSYQFYRGDKSHWIVIGPEISLKKWEKDDYLTFYVLLKQKVGYFKPGLSDTQFVFGINFMPINIY